MINTLQIWHLAWLALTPVLFALFRLSSEAHDSDRVLVDNLVVLATACWAGFVAVYFVVTGRKDEALPNLLRFYRALLARPIFLLVSNLLGTALVLMVAYKLVAFRQVEFITGIDVAVYLNDSPGQMELVGILRGKTPTSFRLPIGEHSLVFRELDSERPVDSTSLVVPTLVRDPAKLRKTLLLRPEPEYGKAK